MLNRINKLSSIFNKKAQLAVGTSSITMDEAKELAQKVQNGLDQIQPELLNAFPHSNLVELINNILNDESINESILHSGVSEFNAGINAFKPLNGIKLEPLFYITP